MLLEIKNLCKSFEIKEHFYSKPKQIDIFKDVNFCLENGQKLNLCGKNGSGKTTLVKTIAMLNDANGGEIIFENKNILGLNYEQKRIIRKDLILIMQNQKSAINPYKKIKWHFDMIEKNYGKKLKIDDLQDFGLNKEILDLRVDEISGGQAQIIGFLGALLISPKLLILDEVEAGMDKNILQKYISSLKKYNGAVILISHHADICSKICDSIYTMQNN